MDIQRLRNLTTGRLHTKMEHVYKDLEFISGQDGLFTHMLPNMNRAIEPYLRKHVTDPRFWDGTYDLSHVGDYNLPTPSPEDQKEMVALYMSQPNPFSS